MSRAVSKILLRWPTKAAVIIAVACWMSRAAFAHEPSPFALQVTLRNEGDTHHQSESSQFQSPSLDYRLMTSLEEDATELGQSISLADRFGSLRLRAAVRETPLPHLLSWMEGWRMDIERGLFRPLRDRAFRMAFAYTDIFDTRGNPDKGGHGLGVLFRYDFRTPSPWR
jgi:hypothetical protein